MPLVSIVQSIGIRLFGGLVGVNVAALIPLFACYAGLVMIAYGVGIRLTGEIRVARLSATLTLFSGFFMPYWIQPDTFALFGLIGAVTLILLGVGRARPERGRWMWAAAGLGSGLAHLTRADGVLFLIVGVCVAIYPEPERGWRLTQGVMFRVGALILGYLVIMSSWFARNLTVIGTPLPTGGIQTVFMRDYAEIVNYPPIISPTDFLNWGVGNILNSRIQALIGQGVAETGVLWTFFVVEGMILLTPFMLIALWRRRLNPFLSAFILYAVGLHLAMSVVFALPGTRGGLLHSAAALIPFWMVLGAIGLFDTIQWAARKRRWRVEGARQVFGGALSCYALLLSINIFIGSVPRMQSSGRDYQALRDLFPSNSVVMVNDPPAFYYHTGQRGVVVPNTSLTILPTVLNRFGVTHILLDRSRTDGLAPLYTGQVTLTGVTRRILPPQFEALGYRLFEVIR
jgi:4-amino-4-deoxy-L-arabinose transferase-like glycosyltransferase